MYSVVTSKNESCPRLIWSTYTVIVAVRLFLSLSLSLSLCVCVCVCLSVCAQDIYEMINFGPRIYRLDFQTDPDPASWIRICLLAEYLINLLTGLNQIMRHGRPLAKEKVVKFWSWSGS